MPVMATRTNNMALTLDELKEQLAQTEAELEASKAHVYRCDGAIQVLKHLIELAQTETEPSKETE